VTDKDSFAAVLYSLRACVEDLVGLLSPATTVDDEGLAGLLGVEVVLLVTTDVAAVKAPPC
jgi:hypothetical protein